jgi:hypothetical protein
VIQRRTFLGTALAVANASPLFAVLREERWDAAAEVLELATAAKLGLVALKMMLADVLWYVWWKPVGQPKLRPIVTAAASMTSSGGGVGR